MGLCRKLGLEVTAEGVADLPQLAVLLPEESVGLGTSELRFQGENRTAYPASVTVITTVG